MKKTASFILAFVFLFILSSCNDKKDVTSTTETDETQYYQATESVITEAQTETISAEASLTEATVAYEATTAYEVQMTEAVTQAVYTTEALITEAAVTDAVSSDASSWDKEKIVEVYKTAAEKTGTSVKSEQTVGLQDISVNNGQLGGVFSFVTPILSSFLSSSTTVTDGITGEYQLLTSSDVASARAYEGSKGTVIEMTLNTQTNSGDTDTSEGSVAHGIYVVGDLLSVMSQLKDKGLPLDISLENTVITYSEPEIRVLIDSEGKIVNGTWSCVVEISLSNYKFAGSTVDSTVVVLNNKITAGGGFSA